MKKNLLLTIVCGTLLCFSEAQAQDKRTSVYGVEMRTNAIEIGPEYLMPQGGFSNVYDKGFGANFKYRFAITEFKSATASIGFNTFQGKLDLHGNNPIVDLQASFIPIKVGMKFRFLKYVYLAGEIGSVINLGVSGIENVNAYAREDNRIKGLLFDFAPTVGFQIPTVGKNYVDLSLRYEGMVNNQQQIYFTGIRAAYGIDIKRR